MQLIDLNGSGEWSRQRIMERYAHYCKLLGIPECTDITPLEMTGNERKWVYPVMDKVIEGMEAGDRGCILLGIDFIEEDQKFPFGRILKSNTARALRRADLDEADKERIRTRCAQMLINGNVPHEYKQYAKLLKKIGVGPVRQIIEAQVDRDNPYVMRYVPYLLDANGHS